jgi:aerobic-type carbon monoxide dehydrogenase small subunit (CoxS/CutS family)
LIKTIQFRLNGKPTTAETDDERSLLWLLRTDLELTGTKYGCGAGSVQGKDVTTIEGLERNGKLHALQQAFLDEGGFQCGYCTPGMIMNAYALLLQQPQPTRDAIVQGMERNLCRCGAHQRIIAAIQSASRKGGQA